MRINKPASTLPCRHPFTQSALSSPELPAPPPQGIESHNALLAYSGQATGGPLKSKPYSRPTPFPSFHTKPRVYPGPGALANVPSPFQPYTSVWFVALSTTCANRPPPS